MNPHTPVNPPPARPSEEVRAWLSALTDGEADRTTSEGAFAAWRDDPGAREVWHRYQVIGDVLRSAELAPAAGRDAGFLAALRIKLAAEPVLLAPAPLPAPALLAQPRSMLARGRWLGASWRLPAAAAAGFAAVAGVLLVMRLQAPTAPAAGPQQARAPAAGLLLTAEPERGFTAGAGAAVIRDARLDAYLSAHQAARGGGMAAVRGAALRQVEAVVPVSSNR